MTPSGKGVCPERGASAQLVVVDTHHHGEMVSGSLSLLPPWPFGIGAGMGVQVGRGQVMGTGQQRS